MVKKTGVFIRRGKKDKKDTSSFKFEEVLPPLLVKKRTPFHPVLCIKFT